MKSTDLRAKARAIFGNAIAEPMPKQPNGAKALQQRANARPIPTYKVGGVVKKNDGGLLKKPVRGRSVTIPLEEEKLQTRRDFLKPLPKKQPKVVDFEPRRPKTGKAPANAPKPPEMMRGPTKPGREEARMEARRAAQAAQAARRSPEADDVLITTRRGQQIMEEQKRREMMRERALEAQRARADRLLGNRMKNGGKAGCYKDGGKVQTSSDTARKLATEMGGMKKGGKAKDGLAVMIAIGSPKKPVKKATGGLLSPGPKGTMVKHTNKKPQGVGATFANPRGMDTLPFRPEPSAPAPRERVMNPKARAMVEAAADKGARGAPRTAIGRPLPMPAPEPKVQYKDGGSPVKKAVGGAGKVRKGMAPIKKAQGGAAKVRKGMMTPEGKIIQAVNKVRG